jgi:arylsulfatase A-like enzyme
VPAASAWLRENGYRTHFFGAGGKSVWHDYRNLGPAFLPHGFDLARDGYRHWSNESRPWPFLGESYMDEALFDDACRLVRENGDQKFFLMLWNYETHYYYPEGDGPQTWNEEQFPAAVKSDPEQADAFRRYLRTLWRVDRLISRLYGELEAQGLADDTLVAVTADHGEAFGQHGWFLHGHSLHEEEVHVPLVLISPRLARLGPRQPVLGSHVDLWPTIADICGLTPDPRWQGQSLLAPVPEQERRAYFYRIEAMGVRQERYKYIWDHDAEREYLFDLEQDADECHNLAKEQPSLCAAQRRRLRDWTIFQRQHVEASSRKGE